QALPERNEISRSADQPPIRTATCLLMRVLAKPLIRWPSLESRMGGASSVLLVSRPYPLDFPIKFDATMLLDALAHNFAQIFDLGGGGAAPIDEKIAVQLGCLGVAQPQTTASGGVNKLPCLVTGRIFESRAPGAAFYWLRRLARLGDLVHLRGDGLRITGHSLKECFGEDDLLGEPAMAIAVMHVAVGEEMHAATAIDTAYLDDRILCFPTVGAAVHPQRPADRAR